MKRDALYFHDIEALRAFASRVGMLESASVSLELLELSSAGEQLSPSFLLYGFVLRKNAGLYERELLRSVGVNVKDEGSTVFFSRTGEAQREVVRRCEGASLLSLLPLQPWKQPPNPPGKVVFWLRDRDLLPRIARASLQLSNDRVQFAAVTHKKTKVLLLSIESPSNVLLEASLEDWTQGVQVFRAASEDLFVQWGFTHPLEERWKSSKQEKRVWSFLVDKGTHLRLDSLQWRDIYSITEFGLEFSREAIPLEVSQEPPTLDIPLRMEPRTHALRADLWMVKGEAVSVLESMLFFPRPGVLNDLLISPHLTEDGDEILFLRERRAGDQERVLNPLFQPLSCLEEFHNCLVPSNRVLLPLLKRSHYASVLSLKSGELTILNEVEGRPRRNAYEVIRIQENSFRPLRQWVDTLLWRSREKIHKKLTQSRFEWGDYEQAPSRPELLPKKPERVQPSASRNRAASRAKVESAAPDSASKHRRTKSQKRSPRERPQRRAHTPSEEERRVERQQELELILEGPSTERWFRLAETKWTQRKTREALDCLEETIWLERDRDNARTLHELWRDWLLRSLGVEGSEAEKLRAMEQRSRTTQNIDALMAWLLSLDMIPESQRNQWSSQCTRLLLEHQHLLRKKVRWMGWRLILLHNQDIREEARCREDLLQDLNQRGVLPEDIPGFLRERLLESVLQLEEDSMNDEEVSRVLGMLEGLDNAFGGLQSEDVRATGVAVLGRAFSRFGLQEPARESQSVWAGRVSSLTNTTLAWCNVFFREAERIQGVDFLEEEWRDPSARMLTLKIADASQWIALNEVETSLKERRSRQTQTEALTGLQEQRLYPSKPAEPKPLEALGLLAEAHYRKNEMESLTPALLRFFQELSEGFASRSRTLDVIDACRGLDRILPLLNKISNTAGEELCDALEATAEALLGLALEDALQRGFLEPSELMYLALVQSSVGKGLLALNREWKALELMQHLVGSLSVVSLNALDYLDMSSQVLVSIELFPLVQRGDLLSDFVDALVTHTNGDEKVFYSMEQNLRWLYPLLDQLVECAISKQRWSLEQYKLYADRDEMVIRERILHENMCDPIPYNMAI